MRRTRAPDNVAVIPAMSDTETGGYYGDGPPATIFSKDDANIIQEELVAIATMKGASLDTTGATRDQCKTAVDAVLGIEARAAEAATVTTSRRHVVIASFEAEVGEDAGGVVNTLVAASHQSAAKGFQSAVIASHTCRAGDTGGNNVNCAVIASSAAEVEGNNAAVIASTGDGGDIAVRNDLAAMIACQTDGSGYVDAQRSLAAASFAPIVTGSDSVVIASAATSTVSGAGSASIGSSGNTVAGDGAAALGHFGAAITANGDNSVALGGTTADIDAANAATIGGTDNEIAEEGCVIIGSDNCQIPSTTNNQNIVILGSKFCDPDLGTTEDYMVCGGYHASTDTAPSWRIESQGGTLHATNTTVQGLDYAEFMPNADGVAHEPGQLLAPLGLGATLAKRGDELVGGVSVTPTITGGDDSIAWRGRYERDEWGAVVYETIIADQAKPDRAAVKAYKAQRAALAKAESKAKSARSRARARLDNARREVDRPGGSAAAVAAFEQALAVAVDEHVAARAALAALTKPAPIVTQKTMRAPKVSANYKPGKHIPRAKRPGEWTRVGLLGQIRVRVDDTVGPDMSVVAGDVPGRGTAGPWIGRGAQFRCLAITSTFDPARGYAIALCLVR